MAAAATHSAARTGGRRCTFPAWARLAKCSAALLLAGCVTAAPEYTGTIAGSLSLETGRAKPVDVEPTTHSVADCPDGGWIEQADGHRVRCPDCETETRQPLFRRRRRGKL